MIDVPDDEIGEKAGPRKEEHTPAPSGEAEQLISQFKQILGPYYKQRSCSTTDRDKKLLIEALEEKYGK